MVTSPVTADMQPLNPAPTLTGLCVLNPRPARQAAELSAALSAAGAQVMALPLLEIVPLSLETSTNQHLMDLDRFHTVVFVSANAARLGLEAVAHYWPQWPVGLTVVAVGPATRAILDAAGLRVVSPEQEDSEGMLALPELNHVAGQRVLVFRGDEGRELLPETLRARGATVNVLPLYTRRLPAACAEQWRHRVRMPDVVLLSSHLIWQHWQRIAGSDAIKPVLMAVSERLAERVRAAGAQQVICSAGATPQKWLLALQEWQNKVSSLSAVSSSDSIKAP